MSISVFHRKQTLPVPELGSKDHQFKIQSRVQRQATKGINALMLNSIADSTWPGRCVHQNVFLSREEAISYKASLIPGSPLFSEVSRALLMGSGIHKLSNGIKIYATPTNLKLLGGGFTPNLQLFSTALTLTTQLRADITNTSYFKKIDGELRKAIRYLSGMEQLLSQRMDKFENELSENNAQQCALKNQLNAIQAQINDTFEVEGSVINEIDAITDDISIHEDNIQAYEDELESSRPKFKLAYLIPFYGQGMLIGDAVASAVDSTSGYTDHLERMKAEEEESVEGCLDEQHVWGAVHDNLLRELDELKDAKLDLNDRQSKLDARLKEIGKLHTNFVNLLASVKTNTFQTKLVKASNDGNLILAEVSELTAVMLNDFHKELKGIDVRYKRMASTNDLRTICSEAEVLPTILDK